MLQASDLASLVSNVARPQRTVTEKSKTLVGHSQLPKGWWGKYRGAGGKMPPPLCMVKMPWYTSKIAAC